VSFLEISFCQGEKERVLKNQERERASEFEEHISDGDYRKGGVHI